MNPTNKPKVSIVTPNFNGIKFIEDCIVSVRNQTYPNWEHIIIDDGSTDGSSTFIRLLADKDPRVRFIEQAQNRGVAETRNLGIAHSEGEYIAFLDADDRWHSEKLELQIDQMQRKDILISYCDYTRINEKGEHLKTVVPPDTTDYKSILVNNSIANSSAVFSRAQLTSHRFEQVGHEDFRFWMKALKKIPKAEKIQSDFPLMYYTVHIDSLSARKLKCLAWQWANFRSEMSAPRSLLCLLLYIKNALAKRI